MRRRLAAALLAILAAGGCGSARRPSESAPQPVAFVRISAPLLLPPGAGVIRDADAWRHVWRRHASPEASPEPPAVDFRREMVLAVSYGKVSSTCYSYVGRYVWRAETRADTLHVLIGQLDEENARARAENWSVWVKTAPLHCDAEGHPVHLVRVPRARTVVFRPTYPTDRLVPMVRWERLPAPAPPR